MPLITSFSSGSGGSYTFGWTPADVTSDTAGNIVSGVPLTVWTTAARTEQVTELFDADGVTPLAGGVVRSDATGRYGFVASDAFTVLYVWSGSGAAWPVLAHEVLDSAAARSAEAVASASAAEGNAAAAQAAAESAASDASAQTSASLSSTFVRKATAAKRSGVAAIAVPRDSTGAVGSAARLQLTGSAIGMDVRSVGIDGAVYVIYNNQQVYRSYDGMANREAGMTLKPYGVGIGGTGGTFTLTVSGQTTSALAFNATAATVKAALEALSTVGAGNADVYDTAGATAGAGPFTVLLKGAAAGLAVTGSGAALTGGTLAVAINNILWATRTSAGYVVVTNNAGTNLDRAEVWFYTSFTGTPTLALKCRSTTLTGIGRPQPVAGVTWLAFGEYNIFSNPSASLKRFGSFDGGQTWALLRSTTVTNSAVNAHNHIALITAAGRIYSSEGDGPNAWFGYSDDRGKTWVPVKTDPAAADVYDPPNVYMQPTTLIDFTSDNRISASPDRGPFPPGMWDLDASTMKISRNYDLPGLYELGAGSGMTAAAQYGHPMYAQRGREAYVMLPDTGSGSKKSHIIATGDAGATWWLVGTIDWGTGAGTLTTGIYGVDLTGHVFMTGLNLPAPYGSGYISAPALDWDWQNAPSA